MSFDIKSAFKRIQHQSKNSQRSKEPYTQHWLLSYKSLSAQTLSMAIMPILTRIISPTMQILATISGTITLIPNPKMPTSDGCPHPLDLYNLGPGNRQIFGDTRATKGINMIFQNIGGFQLNKDKLKEDTIRTGITIWLFDIFGITETGTDWRPMPDDHKSYTRTIGRWDSLYLSMLLPPPLNQ